MARQKTSPLEDMVLVASKLPWWAGAALALVSYLVLHAFASRPATIATGPGQMGAAMIGTFISIGALFGQFILPFVFGLGALISAFNVARQKKLYNNVAKRSGVATLNEMNWGDFERLVSEHYRRKGFQVTREGGNGPDGGIDLVLRQKGETYLVQCKQWKAYKVGVQPVREFYGVMASRGAAGGYFVTSGEYTNEAKAFAQRLNLELLDGRKLREMIDDAQQPVLTRVSAKSRLEPVAASSRVTHVVHDDPVATNSGDLPVELVAPECPVCGARMTKRVARHGSQAGKEFWGCTTYPKCKGTRKLDELASDERSVAAPPEPVATKLISEKRTCPDCGMEMLLRKFQSGPRIGEQFYGCIPCKKGWSIGQVG